MKKLINAKLSLAAFAAAFAIVTTGCDANVNLNVGSDSKTDLNNTVTSVIDDNADTNGSAKENAAEEKEADKSPVTEETQDDSEKETAEEENKETEASEEKTEEAPAEEAEKEDSVVVETHDDGTSIVLEDGIRYARMTYDPNLKYSKYNRYTEDEIEKINEDLKKIEHDAFEKYGNWQRSGTEEQQRDGVSYVSFRDIDDPSGYLKDIWEIDLGNPEGRIYYDMHTLKVLTIEDLFGSEWKENNTAESDDDTSGSDELVGKMTYFYDVDLRKVNIIFENSYRDINIKMLRDYIVQDYVGAIDGSAK